MDLLECDPIQTSSICLESHGWTQTDRMLSRGGMLLNKLMTGTRGTHDPTQVKGENGSDDVIAVVTTPVDSNDALLGLPDTRLSSAFQEGPGDGVVVLQQPPQQWYQRGTGQMFAIRSTDSFDDYTLDLLFAPRSGGFEYAPVRTTRQVGTGLVHHKSKDIRESNTHLIVYPKIDICTRKGDCQFVLRLSLSSGRVVTSRPFGVKNRKPNPTSFTSDAKRALNLLEWCPSTGTCHICNQTFRTGHLPICAIGRVLAKTGSLRNPG